MLENDLVNEGRSPFEGLRPLEDPGGIPAMEKFSLKRNPALVTVLALIAAYALAYLYELSLLRLIRHLREQPVFGPYWQVDLVSSIVPLFVLILIATLAWFGLRYLPPSRISAALYILPGLFTIGLHYYHYLAFLSADVFFPRWLGGQTFLGQIRMSFMAFGAGGYASTIHYLATGCILIGIAAFIRYRKEKRETLKD